MIRFLPLSTIGRTLPAALILLLTPAAETPAQESPRLNGYLEHQYSVSRIGGRWTHLDYDRFRADLEAQAGRSTRASAALIWQIFRGGTSIRLPDLFPEELRSLAPDITVEIEDQHYLNHAYIVLHPGPVEVTLGKQYLAWGRGMVFNPTELFRPKSLLEPSYEREGVGALSASLPTGQLGDVQLVVVPRERFRTSSKVLRTRQHLSGFDVSAMVAELHESVDPALPGRPAGDVRRRLTAGGDITGELLGFGVWVEGTYSEHGEARWWEVTAGGNYTLPWGTLVAVEGYYDGRGEWNDPYPYLDWLGRLSGARRTLGKGMVFATVSHQLRQLWTLGLSGLVNAGDGSAVVIPSLLYSFAQDVDLIFNGIVFVGDDGTEFGSQGHSAFLRARVYF